jgi:cytoskeleton protein RodZ
MSQTLGEKLRQAREERGISVSEVAEQTRISPLYIDSIEKDDYKPLPGGIFNKGFVKSYAKFIGMDEHEALQDYSKIVAQTEGRDEDDLRTYRPEVLTDDRAGGSMVPTIIFAGIILALMTGGLLFVVNYLQNQPSSPTPAGNVANTSVPSGQNTAQSGQNPAAPALDEIKLDFRATTEKINVESVADGQRATQDVLPGTPKTFTAKDSLTVSYYRGFEKMVELTLNGKQIAPPPAPARGSLISVEINRDNLERIINSGSLTVESTPVAAATPAATQVQQARTAPSPESSPAETPRPVAARSPAAKPKPNPTRTPIIAGNAARSTSNRP